MHHNYYLSPLVAAMALTLSHPVKAAIPLVTQDNSFTTIQKKFNIDIPGVTQLKAPAQSINRLQYIRKNVDKNKIAHVRMLQTYAGIEVHGGYTILHSEANKTLTATSPVFMNGTLYEGLESELGTPALDYETKGNQAIDAFAKRYTSGTISERKVKPIIYIDAQDKAHWAYKVSIKIEHSNKMPERPTAILDAETFKHYILWDDIKTGLAAVKGHGYGGNTKAGKFEYGSELLPYLNMQRDDRKNSCYLQNSDVTVVDMKNSWSSTLKTPMQFKCVPDTSIENEETIYFTGYKGDGYDKINGAHSPTNDALYSGYVIKHMYLDWYGLHALTKPDGSPLKLVMRVHYGSNFENAYWDDSNMHMTFGDGYRMFYPLVSLGVATHEVSHGFTSQHSDLIYTGQSGGMNESFSDMAAAAAEYYSTGKINWMVGEEIMKPGSGMEALRYMDVPSKDGTSIDSADQYYNGLDVHYSSGVFNRMFYLISTTPGWNTRMAFDVMVKANADYWVPSSTFEEGGCGVLNAAQDLRYPLDDIKAALNKVAVDYSQCLVRILPVEDKIG